MNSKIKKIGPLAKTLAGLKKKGRKIVFTNGCFDILHVGHVTYLKKARSLGDVLVVGLNSDRSVRSIKGEGRPVNTELDRAEVLAALGSVDYVAVFDEDTPEKLIKKLRPDILVKGGDWKEDDIVGAEFVKSHGGRVVRIPFVKGHSTTSLIRRISGHQEIRM